MRSSTILAVITFFISPTLFAGNKSCVELISMTTTKLNFKSTVQLANSQTLHVRIAKESDVTAVTELTHAAFEIWKNLGLKLSPMFQTDEKTASYLMGKGFVVEDSNRKIVATFSLEDGAINRGDHNTIRFTEGDSPDISFTSTGEQSYLNSKPLLIFKKLAVHPALSNSGLGNQLYQIAETMGRENSYSGMILETVKEARWLYDWYIRLGFTTIGAHKYPGSQVETLLLIKPFHGEQK